MRKKSFPLAKVYQLLEPGPVVMLTTVSQGQPNIMTTSWHTMLDFEPPLIGCVISSSGIIIWTKTFAGTPWVQGYAIIADNIGSVYLTGTYTGDSLVFDNNKIKDTTNYTSPGRFYLAKISSAGICDWLTRGLNDYATSYYNSGRVLRIDKLGRIYVVVDGTIGICYDCGKEFLVKYDITGNLISSRIIGDMYTGISSLAIDDSLNIFYIFNGGGHYGGDVEFAKLDSLMNVKWQKNLGGWCPYNLTVGLSVDSFSNTYVAGQFGCTTDSLPFDNLWAYSTGYWNVVVAKIDPSGNYKWIKTAGGKSSEYPTDMCTDKSGTCYLTGDYNDGYYNGIYNDAVKFDNDTLRNDGNWRQLFVAKLNSSNMTIGVQSFPEAKGDFTIYPNPSSGIFIVDLRNYQAGAKVTIHDVLGNCLLERNCRGKTSQEINLSCQPKGIYFIEIVSDRERAVKKIVLE